MVYDKVVEIICDKLELEPDQINLDSSFDSLKVDSLDLVEIVMDLEDEFGIEIDESSDITTVSDLVEYIEHNI